jgi:hypothetical protein
MKLYGIFDSNNILLRYSYVPQETKTYEQSNYPLSGYTTIIEHCLPDIEYSIEYIGKYYNPTTNIFTQSVI